MRTARTLGLVAALAAIVGTGLVARQHYSAWAPATNLGAVVNSGGLDGCPAISRDGLSLYFATIRPPADLDIWVSQRASDSDPWQGPAPVTALNVAGSNDFCPALSVDGHYMYMASNRPGGCGGNDIYVARRKDKRDDFGWVGPVHLGCVGSGGINTPDNDFSPNYYEDGGVPTLLFTSNRAGGLGGNDIWVTRVVGGAWSAPENVIELNTALNDQQTSIRQRDGKEIIFTSNRAGGQGGVDLWVALLGGGGAWLPPTNMGPAVNSTANDARPTLSWDGTELFFGSARPGGFGGDDLYVATRERLRPAR